MSVKVCCPNQLLYKYLDPFIHSIITCSTQFNHDLQSSVLFLAFSTEVFLMFPGILIGRGLKG